MNLTPGPQHSAAKPKPPRKRKRSSVCRPSAPSAHGPAKSILVPAPPSSIPPADLPVASNFPPGPPANQPSSTAVNEPVKIHNCSVEDYQRVYHEVVDDLLRYVWVKHADSFNQIITFVSWFKNLNPSITFYTTSVPSTPHRYPSGRVRPYSLQLGRRIKWKLWERMDRPAMTSSTRQDGLTHVDVSFRAGLSPPLYDVDTLGEPSPGQPPLKRAKKSDWPESSGFTQTRCKNSWVRSNPACKY